MPTINLQPIGKPKQTAEKQGKAKRIYDTVYNTTRWRSLRQTYLCAHPLCELCLQRGIVAPATDVHHKLEISNAQTDAEMLSIGFDYNNLQSLCESCHTALHANKKRKPQQTS